MKRIFSIWIFALLATVALAQSGGIGIQPVVRGGTGSSTAAGARENLGVELGVDVETPAAAQAKADAAQAAASAERGSGPQRCYQLQRFVLPPNAWTTLLNATGAEGTIENLWLAVDRVAGNGSAFTAKLRITFDGAATPQFGGVNGIAVQDLMGVGLGAHVLFRSRHVAVSQSSASGWSGNLAIPMPFGDSVKIEIYLTSNADAWVWMMAEVGATRRAVGDLVPGLGWVLAATQADVTPAAGAEATLLSVSAPVRIFGANVQFLPQSGGTNFYYLEGDFLGYPNGSGTPSYESSGAEDFFMSSYYFKSGLFSAEKAGLTYKESTNGYVSAYRFFDEQCMLGADTSYVFSWVNGDSDYPGFETTYATRILATIFYYTR